MNLAAVTTLLIAFGLTACGRGLTIDSPWLDRTIVIDGADSDWNDLKLYVESWPVDIGVANDADYLYLTLSTADRSLQRQAVVRGFEVWIDPGGGKRRILGVRYPEGMFATQRREFSSGIDPSTRMRSPNPWRVREELDRLGGPEQLQKAFERMLLSQQPVLLGKGGKELQDLSMAGDEDVQVAVTYTHGRLVYEARFPLRGQYPLPQLPAKEGKDLGVGFLTREMERSSDLGRSFRGAGLGNGYRTGRYGGVGGYPRRPSGPVPTPAADPVEKWTKIRLSKGQ